MRNLIRTQLGFLLITCILGLNCKDENNPLIDSTTQVPTLEITNLFLSSTKQEIYSDNRPGSLSMLISQQHFSLS